MAKKPSVKNNKRQKATPLPKEAHPTLVDLKHGIASISCIYFEGKC
jgi:hypothetical protein